VHHPRIDGLRRQPKYILVGGRAGGSIRMKPTIYHELSDWYDLIDPREDHADEAACYLAAFLRGIQGPARTLLELGCGAGNNASFLTPRFACTLTDISEAMLARSRARNPECEHLQGDMRTLRLGRTFDAVLVHDAVVYMTTEADLRAAIETAFVHTRPGGAAIFTPDDLEDGFVEEHDVFATGDGGRACRVLEWTWDPVPGDGRARTDYVLAMREGGTVRVHHDCHEIGLFSRATWLRLLSEAGFEPETVPRPIGETETDEIFLCRRPAQRSG